MVNGKPQRLLPTWLTGLYREAQGGLCGSKPRHRHPVGRAGDIVEIDVLAEPDGLGVAAMLAADADLEVGVRPAPALNGNPHKLADGGIERDEGVVLDDSLLGGLRVIKKKIVEG